MTGCKTLEDATAAATQMSATVTCLSDYYAGLGVIEAETEQIKILNEQLYDKPYREGDRALMKSKRERLAKRVELAADFSQFAGQFAKLAGSKAPADVAESGDKLRAEIESLEPMKSNSEEQEALKLALKAIVSAVLAKNERDAAKAIESFTNGLNAFFNEESAVWRSEERVHTELASTLAGSLVDDKYTDSSAMLKVALDPFGLTPFTASADLTTKLAPLAKQQIAARGKALDDAYDKGTDAMAKSLDEMSKRIHLVAEGQPMQFREPPLTLATVEKWAAQAGSF